MTFNDLPARQKNEAPATKKQVEFILQLAPELDATAVAKLGKWQASAFIDAALRERNDAPWLDDEADGPNETKTQGSCLKTTAKLFLALLAFSLLATVFFPNKPATREPASKQPRSIPTGPSAEAAKERAATKYPRLRIAGSPEHTEFMSAVALAQKGTPSVFDDPEWPTIIADSVFRPTQK